MGPQIQTALPKYSENLLVSQGRMLTSMGASQRTLSAPWPYSCSGVQLGAFFTSTRCIWKQDVVKFGSPSLFTGYRWQLQKGGEQVPALLRAGLYRASQRRFPESPPSSTSQTFNLNKTNFLAAHKGCPAFRGELGFSSACLLSFLAVFDLS